MYVRRRAAAVAAIAALSLTACVEADNGNNTLAYNETEAAKAPSTAPGAPQSTAPARPQPGGPVDLETQDNKFVPDKISAAAGQLIINMRNTGQAPHTFTSEQLKVDVNANAGQDAEIKLTKVDPGTYKFVCKYHPEMVGELTAT